jgi:hypothetical protein
MLRRVAVDEPAFTVGLPDFATPEVFNDLARSVDSFLLRVGVGAGALVVFLDHVPTAALLVRNYIAVVVVSLAHRYLPSVIRTSFIDDAADRETLSTIGHGTM